MNKEFVFGIIVMCMLVGCESTIEENINDQEIYNQEDFLIDTSQNQIDFEVNQLRKLESILAKKGIGLQYGYAYLPATLYQLNQDIYLAHSVYKGGINFQPASPYYINISSGKIQPLRYNQKLEKIFSTIAPYYFNVSCYAKGPYPESWHRGFDEFNVTCENINVQCERKKFTVLWPKNTKFENFAKINITQDFMITNYKGASIYFNDNIVYYKKYVYKSMGYRSVPITHILVNDVYNLSEINFTKNLEFCGVVHGNWTFLVEVKGGWGADCKDYTKNVEKYIDKYDNFIEFYNDYECIQ